MTAIESCEHQVASTKCPRCYPAPDLPDPGIPVGRGHPPNPGIPSGGWRQQYDHWVRRRAEEPAKHECAPPTRSEGILSDIAEGAQGDLWRCRCGRLWLTGGWSGWLPATWWQRLRYIFE